MNNKEMNELAKTMVEDGQAFRAIYGYLQDTFDGVKHQELFDSTFTDRIEFIKYIQYVVCPGIISSIEEWKLDEPEEYIKANQY